MLLIFSTLALLLTGFLLVCYLVPKLEIEYSLLMGYPIGLGVFTFLAFVGNLLGVPYSSRSYLLLASILLGVISTLHFLRFQMNPIAFFLKAFSKLHLRLSQIWRKHPIGCALLCIVLLLPLVPSLYWPTKDWDSFALYDFRAISFARTGTMEEAIARGYFFGYPLHTSIAQTLVHFSDLYITASVHYPFFLCFSLFVLLFLNKRTNATWAIVWTALIASLPTLFGHAQMTYTNLMYSVYLVLAHLTLLLWYEKRLASFAALTGLLVGLSIWTRSTEPFWIYPTLAVFAVAFLHKQWIAVLLYLTPVLTFRYVWTQFESQNIGITTDLVSNAPSLLGIVLQNWMELDVVGVIGYVLENVLLPEITVYSIFLLSLLGSLFLKKRYLLFSLSILFFLSLTLAGTAVFSLYYESWDRIGGSAQRMTMFLAPLILMFGALISYQLHTFLNEKK